MKNIIFILILLFGCSKGTLKHKEKKMLKEQLYGEKVTCSDFLKNIKKNITMINPFLCYESYGIVLQSINERDICFIGFQHRRMLDVFGNPSDVEEDTIKNNRIFHYYFCPEKCSSHFREYGHVEKLPCNEIRIAFSKKESDVNGELISIKYVKYSD